MPFRAFDLVPVITSVAHDVGDPSLKVGCCDKSANLYLPISFSSTVFYVNATVTININASLIRVYKRC